MTDRAVVTRRHILVTLTGGSHQRAGLETVVRLARRREAELRGLFIEDADLMRLAALPFASEVAGISARARSLTPAGMGRALRILRAESERALMQAAESAGVSYAFHSVQGRVSEALHSWVGDAEVVVLAHHERVPWAPGLHAPTGPLTAVYTGSRASLRAVDFAAELCREEDQPLMVLALPQALTEDGQLPASLSERLDTNGLDWEWRRIPGLEPAELRERCRRLEAGGLVGSLEELSGDAAQLDRLVRMLGCPLMLVR